MIDLVEFKIHALITMATVGNVRVPFVSPSTVAEMPHLFANRRVLVGDVLAEAVAAAARRRGLVAMACPLVDPPDKHCGQRPRIKHFRQAGDGVELRLHYARPATGFYLSIHHLDSLEPVGAAPHQYICLAAADAGALAGDPDGRLTVSILVAESRAGADGLVAITGEEDLDVADIRDELVPLRRQVVRPAVAESASQCAMGTTTSTARKLDDDAVDAHRGVGVDGDVQHLHGAVAEEQVVGAVAGEVEAAGVEAAGLDAERVRDADVAAPPGTATAAANWDGGCRGPQHPTAGCAMAIYRAGCKS